MVEMRLCPSAHALIADLVRQLMIVDASSHRHSWSAAATSVANDKSSSLPVCAVAGCRRALHAEPVPDQSPTLIASRLLRPAGYGLCEVNFDLSSHIGGLGRVDAPIPRFNEPEGAERRHACSYNRVERSTEWFLLEGL